jgi:branched-chain amino acid transport system ATP-binding protein
MKTLVLKNICKNFGGLQALHNVSLEIDHGERRAIIGPNGAGKTTLFSIITGILQPSSGRIYFSGEDIKRLPQYRRMELGISQTFQLIHLFKGLTVLENTILAVKSMKSIRHTLYRPLSSYKHVTGEAKRVINEWGLSEKQDMKVSELSYGDQRLLDILLALAKEPQLLLLDEPSSGLPPADIQTVISRIENLSREITIIFIEHNMDLALKVADKIAVLHFGEIIAEGSSLMIRQSPSVQDIYLGRRKGAIN